MKPRFHLPGRICIQIMLFAMLMWVNGCTSAPVAVDSDPVIIHSDTTTAEPVQVSVTHTEQIFATATLTPTVSNHTATPFVWIDQGTGLPSAPTLPVFPSFTETSTPTITLTPTRGYSPTITITPTASPTITPTSNPPSGVLSIDEPGLASRIASPYKMNASVTRGADKKVYLSLIGENEQIFYSEVLDYQYSIYNRLLVTPTLTFSIPSVAENARLILQTYDEKKRIQALTSVDVILLSIGKSEVNPAQYTWTPFVIDSPKDGDELVGKRLIVSGRATPLNTNPLIIELLDEKSNVIVERRFTLDLPSAGETYTSFTIELLVDVPQETEARLSIRQESDTSIPGTIALSSVAITLNP